VKQHNLPVKVVIMNNRFLGMVKQWQDLFYGKRYASTSIPAQPDFLKLADAYGIPGYRAETPKEASDVLEEALKTRGPALIELVVDPEEHVYPMVPAGAANKDMVLSKAEDEALARKESAAVKGAVRSKGRKR
jgi:acetolactate synthase-1/2/3 large subunit